MFYPFYFDSTMLLLLPGLLLAFYAKIHLESVYHRYAHVASQRGWTAANMAENMLKKNGIYGIRVERIHGQLTDHYDPQKSVLRLSDGVYDSTSLAALGIAAHEVGHAIQHHEEYAPLRLRSAFVPVVQLSSTFAFPLFLLGLLFSWEPLLWIGIIAFSLSVLFYLVTLPVEFNASRRALTALESGGYLEYSENRNAKKVLSAAALTYVASALTAFLQLIRLLMISGIGRRND